MTTGTMLRPVRLTGTSLVLLAGQRVGLYPATNQPKGWGKWFARPLKDAGPEWGEDNSILLDYGDVALICPACAGEARRPEPGMPHPHADCCGPEGCEQCYGCQCRGECARTSE